MADDSQRPARADLAVSVTVSGDPALVDAVRAVAARIGEFAGCPAGEAATLGQAVGHAVSGVAQSTPAGDPQRLVDIEFESNGRLLSVDMSCHGDEAGGFPLEETLAASGDDVAMRGLVDRVEFARTAGRQVCRLTRQVRATR
ncbi:MAG: hypothetical protein KJ066_08005 [Acidobacteria bacterium]|nr:hypothetical protein [Acidobacteriota bacterium]